MSEQQKAKRGWFGRWRERPDARPQAFEPERSEGEQYVFDAQPTRVYTPGGVASGGARYDRRCDAGRFRRDQAGSSPVSPGRQRRVGAIYATGGQSIWA